MKKKNFIIFFSSIIIETNDDIVTVKQAKKYRDHMEQVYEELKNSGLNRRYTYLVYYYFVLFLFML